jgi:hypothetical protein
MTLFQMVVVMVVAVVPWLIVQLGRSWPAAMP